MEAATVRGELDLATAAMGEAQQRYERATAAVAAARARRDTLREQIAIEEARAREHMTELSRTHAAAAQLATALQHRRAVNEASGRRRARFARAVADAQTSTAAVGAACLRYGAVFAHHECASCAALCDGLLAATTRLSPPLLDTATIQAVMAHVGRGGLTFT
jgi:hypothetical protein